MKARSVVLAVFVCLVAAVVFASPHMGTWKLNEAKSKLAAGMGKNTAVIYAAAGDNVKITVDGVDKDGKPAHNEWTGKFDGRDYPVTGDPNSNTRAYTKVDDNTLKFAAKKGGKVTVEGTVVVSADGKTRTVTVTATDDKGAKTTSVAVYDKQ